MERKDPVYIRLIDSDFSDPKNINFELQIFTKQFRGNFRYFNVKLEDIENFINKVERNKNANFISSPTTGMRYILSYYKDEEGLAISSGPLSNADGRLYGDASDLLLRKLKQLLNDRKDEYRLF